MSFNPSGGAQASLSVFSGLCSEMAPPDLPDGVSPDCADNEFVPGNVFSRRCLAKVFSSAFSGSPVPTLTYGKSFVTPSGGIQNLYLDSNGALWMEDLLNSPGTRTQIAQVTPGSYAKSVTAFGREYIAICNTLHGSDIPFQWDGVNLNRVTQDGPGSPPNVSTLVIPAVAMLSSGAGSGLTVVNATTTSLVGGNYTRVTVNVSSGASVLMPGNVVTLVGTSNALLNLTFPVAFVPSDTQIILYAFYSTFETGTGGTTSATSAYSISRANNIVTVNTASTHNLQVGYQAQISGVDATASPVAAISTVIINNTDSPGTATVTTSTPHGLSSGENIILRGIPSIAVGGGISAVSRQGGIVTVTTSAAHSLLPGSVVTLSGVSNSTFNTTLQVQFVIDSTNFTALQSDTADATSSGGNVNLSWPLPDTAVPTLFEVLDVPSATSFQVQVSWSDGTWTSGHVYLPWDGTYFVSTVNSSTQFQYQQNGPDMQSTAVGTVTPHGQVAPGQHQLQVLFLTNQGYVTKPSPPVTFNANGGQYVSVSNIPLGPSNIVARILAFTGAGGAYFFYIPVPAQVNGQIVSTATQINDNTTTSALLDFGDNTLFQALGINIPGNTPVNQIVLDGALAFGYYASRLITWGQRNRIQNLLNMSFDGGALPTSSTLPTGWIPNSAGAGGVLAAGHWNPGWSITAASPQGIHQSFYEDAYGAPIATPNTTYRLRCWLVGGSGTNTVVLTISSVSASFSSTATVSTVGAGGAWVEANFTTSMPTTIPTDMILTITGTVGVLVDEISIMYAQAPHLNTVMFGSYVDNPEAFDGLTGKFGASQDTRKIMDFGIIRQSMNFLTQDPSGRLHQVSDNGTTEPAGWTVNEIASDCGILSAFALTKSQADDNSASGGEEWFAWASSSGARIFGGDQPYKISQEIQPDWDLISPYYCTTTWALNDPVKRMMFFGLPQTNVDVQGAPSKIYTMSYRELDTAYQIATSGPIHTGLSGRLVATDHTRKWSPWNLTMNGASLMYRQATAGPGGLPPEALSVVLFAGNGQDPGAAAGFGNIYTLSAAKLTDDDYGQVHPYYTTYFFVTHEQEQALHCQNAKGEMVPLGSMRKLLQYVTAYIGYPAPSGTCNITLTFYPDSLTNAWPLTVTRALVVNPKFDLECAGGSAIGQRIAIKFAATPASGTDCGFSLQKVTAVLKRAERLLVRGSAT